VGSISSLSVPDKFISDAQVTEINFPPRLFSSYEMTVISDTLNETVHKL